MPPAIPPASPSSIMPPQAPPVLPRANSLSDLSALPSSNPSVVKPPTARQTSPSLPLPTTTSTSGLKLKLNNLKVIQVQISSLTSSNEVLQKERSETSTPISAPSPPKRQPSTTELVQDFSFAISPVNLVLVSDFLDTASQLVNMYLRNQSQNLPSLCRRDRSMSWATFRNANLVHKCRIT